MGQRPELTTEERALSYSKYYNLTITPIPEDHFYARQQMREKVLDPDVPMREKAWGTVHDILEDEEEKDKRLV